MRLPEEKIKAAILHPEAEVRLTALRYFNDSYVDDPSIMPVVVEAVEKYGREQAFDLLAEAGHLRQTPATMDWLMAQLKGNFDANDSASDNLRFRFALTLLGADPELLAPRHSEIISTTAFPNELKMSLSDILKLDFSPWSTLWEEFEELGRKTMASDHVSLADNRRFHRIVKAMAKRPIDGEERVLSLLQGRYRGYDEALMVWLEPSIVELAGLMKLEPAIPLLLERLDDDYEEVHEQVGTALSRIGGDKVIEAVSEKWNHADTDQRLFLIQPFEDVHSDLALERMLALLSEAKSMELRSALVYAALCQFASEAIEPARKVLLEEGEDSGGDYWDLRYRLIATATIMGKSFPEYEAWHADAVASNYGFDYIKDRIDPYWIADSFKENEGSSRSVRRIKVEPALVYQLKVTLKEIKPLIWRRLVVPDCSLDDLHEVIQIAMGWESYHLYCFRIDQREFTRPDMDEGELNMCDSSATLLSEVILHEGQKLIYIYDFGDGWKHEIVVEMVAKAEPSQKHPVCAKGLRACPPEDVGGPCGYAEYLKALADPAHERHDEFLAWRGEFDPQAFDLEAVNRELRNVFR